MLYKVTLYSLYNKIVNLEINVVPTHRSAMLVYRILLKSAIAVRLHENSTYFPSSHCSDHGL